MDYLICRPILTPQKGEPILPCICIGTRELGLRYTDCKFGLEETQYFHLHLISGQDLRAGDYFGLYTHGMKIHRTGERFGNGWSIGKYTGLHTNKLVRLTPEEDHGRVEATTDRSISLPGIPSGFLEEYAHMQGFIKKVKLKLENPFEELLPDTAPLPNTYQISVDKEDRSVIHSRFRDIFDRECAMKIAKSAARKFGSPNLEDQFTDEDVVEWFDEHY